MRNPTPVIVGVLLLVLAVLAFAAAWEQGEQDAGARAAGCRTTTKTIVVTMNDRSYRPVFTHAYRAIRGIGQGLTDDGGAREPRILHIARDESDSNRRQSLRGVPLWSSLTDAEKKRIDHLHWREPHDRDEYGPANADEGGTGADVRYVRSSANRGAGASMGAQLAPYCNGTAFRYQRVQP